MDPASTALSAVITNIHVPAPAYGTLRATSSTSSCDRERSWKVSEYNRAKYVIRIQGSDE